MLFGLISLLIIAVVVQTHIPVSAIDTSGNWGTPIAISPYRPTSYQSSPQNNPSVVQVTQNTTPSTPAPQDQNPSLFIYTDPVAPANGNMAGTIIDSGTSFDFNAFMQQLTSSAPKKPASNPTISANTIANDHPDAYPVVPPQLFSSDTTAAPARTDGQQALYTYGNLAGAYIKAYEQTHTNDSAVVQNYFDDRSSAANATALTALGNDLKGVGMNLKGIESVPTVARTIHTTLANSYIDIGTKLSVVPKAQTNDEIIGAINTYDDALGVYVKSYIALVLLFSQNGVVFGPNEPGSVFMFTPQN